MEYRLVFDVAEAGCRYWWIPCAGVVVVGIGLVEIAWRRNRPVAGASRWRWFRPVFTVLFGAFFATAAFAATYGEYRQLVTAMERREYTVVEGVVHDFVPGPLSEHPSESFEVAGHRYSYSNGLVTEGFNITQSHGGPMRDGLRVRIADVGGRIARLEIAR